MSKSITKTPLQAILHAAGNFIKWSHAPFGSFTPPPENSPNKYIFIVGTGRFGSTFITDYFNNYIDKSYNVHEPNHVIKIMSNMFVSSKVSEKKMLACLSAWRKNIDCKLEVEGNNVYLQSDPWLFGFTPFLEKVFPNAAVIHIVRDPFTYIPSQLNRFYRERWTGFLRDIIPYWRLCGEKTNAFTTVEWRVAVQEIKTAWNWKCINSFIELHKGTINNFMQIKYEEIYKDDNAGLKQMLDFCGLNASEKEVNHLQKNLVDKKKFAVASSWPGSLRHEVISICEELMKQYRY